jgi:hypothetical protein
MECVVVVNHPEGSTQRVVVGSLLEVSRGTQGALSLEEHAQVELSPTL